MVTWALLLLLLFVPMILEFAFASEIITSIQRLFPYWKNKSVSVVLSDILFIQAGAFIVFGALVAGAVLYNTWASIDVRQLQFTKYIWSWRKIKEE